MDTEELELIEETETTPPMSDSELVQACMEEVSRGIGGTVSSNNDADISLPLDYYFGRLPGLSGARAKDPYASQYVSMDVMDGVEATVAEIMPSFSTDMIALYPPDDEHDEDQARMETELVNYLFMEEYNGYTLLQVAIKDVLLHRNCTVKVYWDERKQVEYETFESIPEMALQSVLEPNAEQQQVEVVEQELVQEGSPQAQMAAMSMDMQMSQGIQTPEMAQQMQAAVIDAQDKYTIQIKRTTVIGRPVIESVAPEQIIVAGDATSPYLNDVRFVAHENLETQSSLIEQGFDEDIVNQLSDYTQNVEDLSRSREPEEYNYTASHRSTRSIRVFECYPLIDFDGDGIAERRKVVIGDGSTLLSNEPWATVPLIGGVALVVPHKYKGVSLFDRLKDVQDSKTPVIRSIIDGTQLSSNPRIGVITGVVNIDDMLASRTGGVVRMEDANGVVALPNPEIPMSSYTMLGYMDEQRSERGGAAVGASKQAMAVAGDTAHSTERVMTSIEMGNAAISRSIGETLIRGIFIELHNVLREHYQGHISAKVGGRWLTSVPSEWKKRAGVAVQVGSSQADRQRQAGVLRELIAGQVQMLDNGSTLTSEKKLYQAITDAASLQGIKNPDRYLIDPDSDEGQAASQAMTEQKQQAQQIQDDQMKMMAQLQIQLQQMQEETKRQSDVMDQQIKQNEQLRKWSALELEHDVDISGQGQ